MLLYLFWLNSFLTLAEIKGDISNLHWYKFITLWNNPPNKGFV